MTSVPVRLLVVDRVHRMNRGLVLFFAVFAGAMWWAAGLLGQPRAFAASMAIAFQLGPLLTLRVIPRSLWYLPVSHRDVWRSGWLISTLGVTALTTTAKLVAVLVPWGPGTPGIASIALSAIFDLASTGVGCALVVLAMHPRPVSRALHLPWIIGWHLSQLSLPLAGMALFYLPVWSDVALPVRWSDLHATALMLLVGMLALTAATWFYRPMPPALANPQTSTAPAAINVRPGRRSRLTGIPRLLVREAGWTFAIGGSLALMGVIVVLVLTRAARNQREFMELLNATLQVADARAASAREVGVVALNLILWYGMLAATLAARFPLILRHLRALPIGAARLNALLVGWPALIWVLGWTAGTAMNFVVLGHLPARPHLGSTVAVIDVCALAQALNLRATLPARITVFCAVAGLVPFVSLITQPSPLLLGLTGVASFVTAILVNQVALSHNSTYRAIAMPVVIVQPR